MVSVLIPMDHKPDRHGKNLTDHGSDLISNSISNSVADTDSIDAESGFDDTDTPNDNGLSVIKFVSRFVDKVCGESAISDNHLRVSIIKITIDIIKIDVTSICETISKHARLELMIGLAHTQLWSY